MRPGSPLTTPHREDEQRHPPHRDRPPAERPEISIRISEDGVSYPNPTKPSIFHQAGYLAKQSCSATSPFEARTLVFSNVRLASTLRPTQMLNKGQQT